MENTYTSKQACLNKRNNTKVKEMQEGVSLPTYFNETNEEKKKAALIQKLKGDNVFPGVDTSNIQDVFSGRVGLDWSTSQN